MTSVTFRPCFVLKVSAIKRLGGDVVKVSYDRWWGVMVTHQYDGLPGSFIHPVCNREVIAGKDVTRRSPVYIGTYKRPSLSKTFKPLKSPTQDRFCRPKWEDNDWDEIMEC